MTEASLAARSGSAPVAGPSQPPATVTRQPPAAVTGPPPAAVTGPLPAALTGPTLAALSEPTRRRILERLRSAEASVGELSDRLGLSQPTTSKHLRVLREAGLVSSETAAQRRIYRIEPEPLRLLDAWLAPYRQLWTHHLDALERQLDARERHPESQEE